MSLNMLRTYGDKVSFNIELVHSKFNVVVKRRSASLKFRTHFVPLDFLIFDISYFLLDNIYFKY